MSRRGLGSPAKMAVRIGALVRASPPCRVSMGARVRPTSSGVMVREGDDAVVDFGEVAGAGDGELVHSRLALPFAVFRFRRGRRRRGGC